MSDALLLVFRVNADGSQTVLEVTVLPNAPSYAEFDEYVAQFPANCDPLQFDVVTLDSVQEAFPGNDAYAHIQWERWRSLQVGDVVIEHLAGSSTNAHVTASECVTTTTIPVTTTTTTTTPSPVLPPTTTTTASLVPLPQPQAMSSVAVAETKPLPILAVTGVNSGVLILLALALIIAGMFVLLRNFLTSEGR